MKRIVLVVIAFVVFVSFGRSSAMAFGLGVYGTGSAIKVNEYDKYTPMAGVGLLIDTNVSKDSLFNYRLNIGIEKNFKNKDNIKLYRYNLNNIFAFGLVRTESIRLWLGPSFGASYYKGEEKYYEFWPDFNPSGTGFIFIPLPVKNKLDSLRIHTGCVFGLNYHVTESVSLGFQCEFKITAEEELMYEGTAGLALMYRFDSFATEQKPSDFKSQG